MKNRTSILDDSALSFWGGPRVNLIAIKGQNDPPQRVLYTLGSAGSKDPPQGGKKDQFSCHFYIKIPPRGVKMTPPGQKHVQNPPRGGYFL